MTDQDAPIVGGHSFRCEWQDSTDAPPCGFESVGWPTKKARDARRKEHEAEHLDGTPAPELADSEATK